MSTSSKVACNSAPAAEQARTSEEVQKRPARAVRLYGTAVRRPVPEARPEPMRHGGDAEFFDQLAQRCVAARLPTRGGEHEAGAIAPSGRVARASATTLWGSPRSLSAGQRSIPARALSGRCVPHELLPSGTITYSRTRAEGHCYTTHCLVEVCLNWTPSRRRLKGGTAHGNDFP